MAKTKRFLIGIVVLLILSFVLYINVFVMQKFIINYTFNEIEYRGYTAQDIADIRIDHSYFRRILGYNEWRIAVEFEKKPNIFFWFTYRDKHILFEGVSSEPMMDKESVITFSEKYKKGSLLGE